MSADDARRGGHDGAGRDGVGRPHRRRCAAGHARPRHPPPARRLGDRPGPRRRRGRRPRGRRGAHPVSPARGDRAGAHRRRARRTPRASCARRSWRCTARAPTRCASPPSTRWSSTRSPGGSSTSPSPRSVALEVPFAWLALGSVARREATPGPTSRAPSPCRATRTTTRSSSTPSRSAAASRTACAACGLTPDEKGTTAANPLLVRSLASWQRAARSWLEDPTQEQALILVSVVVDSRTVWGLRTGMSARRGLPRRAQPSRAAAPAGALLALLPPAHRLPARARRRALRRAPRPAGPQARRPRPDRRPRPLGGDGRRGHERLDARAPARRGRRRDAVGAPTPPRWPMPSSS